MLVKLKMINEIKYNNNKYWLDYVRRKDSEFAQAVDGLHYAICLCDDIADRAIHPKMVVEQLWFTISSMNYFIIHPDKWDKIRTVIDNIYKAEQTNQIFVPGKESLEEDLKKWSLRASFLDLYFIAWCVADSTVDTKDNWAWFEKFKLYCLTLDDCTDIESGEFEDARQCKRNYVMMNYNYPDSYTNYEGQKQQLKFKSESIRGSLKLDDPIDSRLIEFMKGGNYA